MECRDQVADEDAVVGLERSVVESEAAPRGQRHLTLAAELVSSADFLEPDFSLCNSGQGYCDPVAVISIPYG